MKKGSLKIFISILISASMLIMAGCGTKNAASSNSSTQSNTQTTEKTADKAIKDVAISTASAGGAWYPIGAAMADVINNANIGLQARVQTTGGAVENVKLINNGDTELGITISYLAYNGFNGIDPYPSKMQNMRTLLSGLSTGVMQIVVLDESPIKKISDLKGKKVAVGPAGGGALTALNDLFKEYGMKMSDINASYVSYDEGVTMMTDKHVDAAVVYAALPTPAVKTLEAQKRSFRLLNIDDDVFKKILDKYPYYDPVTIDKQTYGLSTEIKALGTPNIICINKDIPDDLAYKIVAAFFEQNNLDKIRNSHPSAKVLKLENAAKAPIPLHPGAEKYYKEKGILK